MPTKEGENQIRKRKDTITLAKRQMDMIEEHSKVCPKCKAGDECKLLERIINLDSRRARVVYLYRVEFPAKYPETYEVQVCLRRKGRVFLIFKKPADVWQFRNLMGKLGVTCKDMFIEALTGKEESREERVNANSPTKKSVLQNERVLGKDEE